MIKEWFTYGIAFVGGIALAWLSWVFLVEPNYPYLLLDPNAPVVDSQDGIEYLPIEMTGASADGAIVKRMCVIPITYKNYAHGVEEDNAVQWYSANAIWINWVVLAIALISAAIVYLIRRREKNDRSR